MNRQWPTPDLMTRSRTRREDAWVLNASSQMHFQFSILIFNFVHLNNTRMIPILFLVFLLWQEHHDELINEASLCNINRTDPLLTGMAYHCVHQPINVTVTGYSWWQCIHVPMSTNQSNSYSVMNDSILTMHGQYVISIETTCKLLIQNPFVTLSAHNPRQLFNSIYHIYSSYTWIPKV